MTAWFHHLSISAKLRVVITLSCLGVIAPTCFIFFGYQWFSFREDMVRRLTVRSLILAENTSGALAFRDANDATSVLNALRADPESVKAIVFDREGQPFAHYPSASRVDAGDFRHHVDRLADRVGLAGRAHVALIESRARCRQQHAALLALLEGEERGVERLLRRSV